jgi:hypothetical protein
MGAPDEPTDDDRPERGRWARLNAALDDATRPLREDFEWLIGEYDRLRAIMRRGQQAEAELRTIERTDDDLTELRRHADVLAEQQWRSIGYGPARRHRDAVKAACDALPGLLAEVERLRAALSRERAEVEALRAQAERLRAAAQPVVPRPGPGDRAEPRNPDQRTPCTECGTDPKVCAHLVASKGMAGCCGACATDSTHVRAAAGSPPPTPGPTREQVRHQVNAALRDANEPFSYTQVNRIANAVMLLLAGEPKYPEATDG